MATTISATCVGLMKAVPVLLPGVGSGVPLVAVAEAFTVVPSIEKAMLRLTLAPAARVPVLGKVAKPVPMLYVPLLESDMPVRPAGS